MNMDEMPVFDSPAPRHPIVSFILIVIAVVGAITVAIVGALAGLLGGWIASLSDGPIIELLGGAVAGCLAGTVGVPYGMFCALAFVRKLADQYAWRRAVTNEQPYWAVMAAIVVALFIIFPAMFFWLWLIIAIPSAFLGAGVFAANDSIPRWIVGIGLAYSVAAAAGGLICAEFITPPRTVT